MIDIFQKLKKETEKNNKFVIDEIKRVLRLNPNILQKDIIPTVIENTTVSKNKILKILNTYVDIHWKRTQSKEATNGYEYKVIDIELLGDKGNIHSQISGDIVASGKYVILSITDRVIGDKMLSLIEAGRSDAGKVGKN